MASDARYSIQRINRSHDRTAFDCGEQSLNDYLRRYSRQNTEKGMGTTYVAIGEGNSRVLAFYTISSGQVAREAMPENERTALPRYPIPVVRIGRLAADLDTRGTGLGSLMLIDALRRALSLSTALGVYAIEVEAIDADARRFYRKYGFQSLIDDERHLYITIKSIKSLFSSELS